MIPQHLRPLFWDISFATFHPNNYPEYTIGRILEYGDEEAFAWLRDTFSAEQIKQVIRTERRLSRKSANFWAHIYGIPNEDVAALKPTQPPLP